MRSYYVQMLLYPYQHQCNWLRAFAVMGAICIYIWWVHTFVITSMCSPEWPQMPVEHWSRIILSVWTWLYFLYVCWQLASGIYSFACSLWSHHTDCFLQQIYARDEAAALSSLERTLLSLKGSHICTQANSHMVIQTPHTEKLYSHGRR